VAAGAATVLAPRPRWSGWGLSAGVALTAFLGLSLGSAIAFVGLLVAAIIVAGVSLGIPEADRRPEAWLSGMPRLWTAGVSGLVLLGLAGWAALGTAWPKAAQSTAAHDSLPPAALISLTIAALLLLTGLVGFALLRGRAPALLRRVPGAGPAERPQPRRHERRASSRRR
jgi:hypothetical protein